MDEIDPVIIYLGDDIDSKKKVKSGNEEES